LSLLSKFLPQAFLFFLFLVDTVFVEDGHPGGLKEEEEELATSEK
jgi:hypothetical protein